MSDETATILRGIDAYCSKAGIKPSYFGQKHFQNSRLYERLKNGGGLRLDTYRKLTAILEAGPPATSEATPEGGK